MIKLFNDDCIKIMGLMENNSINCIITDPPYIINYSTNYRKDKTHKFCNTIANDDNIEFIRQYISQCYRILKDNSALFMFCTATKLDSFLPLIKKYNFNIKNIIIWVKNNWTAGDLQAGLGKQYECIILAHKGRCIRKNDYRYSDVWNFNRVSGKDLVHQNQKPVDLLKRCLELYTVDNDIVFDGCMGSGSTGIACKDMNRNFIGCEIDKEYFDIAKRRIYE